MDINAERYQRFLSGDESGLEEIIRDYKDGLILYLNGFINNIHIAEELMEDVFVKLIIKKPKFNKKNTFKAWLYTVGRNTAIDYLRKESKIKKADISGEELKIIATDIRELEKEYIKNEEKRALHKVLAKLNSDYSRVLYLSYFEEFSHDEISLIMKKNKRQIENLIYRAKLMLKKELQKEGFTYEGL